MYQIMRMAEVVRESGVMIYEIIDIEKGKKEKKASKSESAEELFWIALKENNPFCFSKTSDNPQEMKELLDIESSSIGKEDFESPFETFSIEVINSFITVTNSKDIGDSVDIACYMISSSVIKTLSKSLGTNIDMDVSTIFILYEYNNKPYVFLEFVYNQDVSLFNNNITVLLFKGFDGRDVRFYASNSHSHVVKKFTDRLNSNKIVGYEKLSDRVKRKRSDGSNEIIKIKRIVHIAPKKIQNSYSSENKIEVNWSHRFWRRGHWAHFWKDKEKGIIDYDKLGKNRDGIYCVRGKTWRVETIVGEDHLPLVTKARIVEE